MRGSKGDRSVGRSRGLRRDGRSRWKRGLLVVLSILIALLTIAAWTGQFAGRTTSVALGKGGGAQEQQTVFVLGDSFAQSPYFQDQFPDAMGGRNVSIDGVGGSSLDEERQRFIGRIDDWKALLVILDGGLTDSSAVRPIAEIIAQLDPGCGRWLYVEPPHSVANGPAGSSEYRRQSELVAAVKARWPDHFVPLIAALAAGANGSAQDNADVAAGWTPASLRQEGDPIHLNAAGNRILVRTIAQAIAKLDREAVSACSGPSMEQMQTAMNAP